MTDFSAKLEGLDRRDCLRWILLLIGSATFTAPGKALANALSTRNDYPLTVSILHSARTQELSACRHYQAFVGQALDEEFPNIAYLFKAFATSEQVHADNYTRLLVELGETPENPSFTLSIGKTRKNLTQAAGKEMNKISRVYPEFLKQLQQEGFTPAIDSCRYSWLSHRQHEQQIKEIKTYSSWFFGKVADRIEGEPFDFYVCDTCGSTMTSKPSIPCDICTLPVHHYHPIARPVSVRTGD